MTKQQFDWQFLDEEHLEQNQSTMKREELSADEDVGKQGHHLSGQRKINQRLYELIIGIVVFYGMAVYFIWQRAEQRFMMLEQEVIALRSEFALRAGAAVATGASMDAVFVETNYLHFEASQRTVGLVQTVAPLVEAQYVQWAHDLGIVIPLGDDKLQIIVDPPSNPVRNDKDTLVIPSSQVASERYGISEVDVLTNEISVRLITHLLNQVINRQEIKPQWREMTLALQFYLRREYGHNQTWKEEVPYLSHRRAAQSQSLNLAQSMFHNTLPSEYESKWQIVNIASNVADPLVEYILQAYGYAQIPVLLDAFATHSTWETLIPAVFDMTASEFEDNWHAYLIEKYPAPE